MNEKEFDFFISYHEEMKSEVLQLSSKFEHLFKHYKENIKLKSNDSIVKENIAYSIKKSKFFVCCLTKKYIDTPGCIKELIYASNLHKPIFVLQINKIHLDDEDIVGLGSSRFKYIPCYENQFNWAEMYYNSIKDEFEEYMQVIRK